MTLSVRSRHHSAKQRSVGRVELLLDDKVVRYANGGRNGNDNEPNVVLIHGAGGDRTVWQLQTRWLAHHGYRVRAVDLPGHGGSAGPVLATIEEMADWLADFVNAAGVAPAHLVGHSMGTFVVLETAARHPEAARSVVMLGTASAMPVHPGLQAAADADSSVAGELITSWGLGSRAHQGGHESPGMWLIGSTTALLDRADTGVLASDLAACAAYEGAKTAAPQVQCPVSLILGREDKMTPNMAATDLIASFRDDVTTVNLIERVGHFMHTERPIEVRKAIAAAIGRVEATAALTAVGS